MKIESVSKQPNFNGQIHFMPYKKATGEYEDLSKTLAKRIAVYIPDMDEMISKKPYDLFISKSKGISEFYQIDANVNYENVLSEDATKKGLSAFIYENRFSRFPDATAEAIQSFEKAPAYKELTKTKGFFKTIWNYIKGIKA